MSWMFEILAECPLFHLNVAKPKEGQSFSLAAQGEDLGNGLIRTPHVWIVKGNLTATYSDGSQVRYRGVSHAHPRYGEKRLPAGISVATAGKNCEYACCTARNGKKLDYLYVGNEVDVPADPCYIVSPNAMMLNGKPFPAWTIGRRTGKGVINLSEKAFLIWER